MKSHCCALVSRLLVFGILLSGCNGNGILTSELDQPAEEMVKASTDTPPMTPKVRPLVDSGLYRRSLAHMVNGDTSGLWPVQSPLPLEGAVLPFKRIVAYYGNYYSKLMGALGEYPKDEMFARLRKEVAEWEKADPKTPVVPALHYIAVTAQASPGADNAYRLRMPHKEIRKTVDMAAEIGALVFIDIQVGHSTLQKELPEFAELLRLPNVHLGIDPEFSMKGGQRPGAAIGTYDADDINYATGYLAGLVKEHGIPPKILVVHRFTQDMVTNHSRIETRPEVQVVMHMDGWGAPQRKLDTYRVHIQNKPVQFTGFKVFYKNDIKHPPGRLLTPAELVRLKPMPVYIQYQ
jgi:hypothetical protein